MKPHRRIRSSPAMSRRPVQGGLAVAALVLIPLLAVAGSDDLRATLDFTTGVLSLVSLTAAVAWGLLATDRLFLSTRQRLVGQGIHRAAAVASLGFLLLHATVKVSLGHVALLGAVIPFGLGVSGTSGLIGFGALAGLLMVIAAATGAMRGAFAAPGRVAGRWRALHGLAYPAWCSALVHGLYAGRQPAAWVVVMYILCLLAVAAALCLRLLPRPTKHRIADLITTLAGPGALPSEPDPVVRASPLPGRQYAAGPDSEEPFRDTPPGWGDEDREVRGTPIRPRTLMAPSPPLYEAPPLSSERIGPPPPATVGPGSDISAAYRAVSRPAEPSARAGGRRPAPSPTPPAQAVRLAHGPGRSRDPEHAYSRAREADYDAPSYGTPSYAPSAHLSEAPPGPVPANADTGPLPGPLYPPPAGEPWHAPAGDRP